MLESINQLAKEFLEIINSTNKPVRIISHHDTDGITSAAILAKTFKRLDKEFSIRIVKNLEKEIIDQELKRQEKEIIIFSDLGSGSLDYLKDIKQPLFILDHHEINKEKLEQIQKTNKNLKIANPHLTTQSNANQN